MSSAESHILCIDRVATLILIFALSDSEHAVLSVCSTWTFLGRVVVGAAVGAIGRGAIVWAGETAYTAAPLSRRIPAPKRNGRRGRALVKFAIERGPRHAGDPILLITARNVGDMLCIYMDMLQGPRSAQDRSVDGRQLVVCHPADGAEHLIALARSFLGAEAHVVLCNCKHDADAWVHYTDPTSC